MTLSEARNLAAAATSTKNLDARIAYAARARVVVEHLRDELEQLERDLASIEDAIVRDLPPAQLSLARRGQTP